MNKDFKLSASLRAQRLQLSSPRFHSQRMSPHAEKVINQAKRRDRPNITLEQWKRHSYCQRDIIKDLINCPDQIKRTDVANLSLEQFNRKYLVHRKPVVIKGCTSTWKGQEYWNHRYLADTYGDQTFKIGEDDDGQKIRTTMNNFIEYLLHNIDDSPLYLFENTNIVRPQLQGLLDNYQVPPYFKEDLLALLQPQNRPPYRWFLMGPQRSGSTVHVDPMMTCAWNTSLVGHKRWVIFGASTPKSIVKGKQFRPKDYVDEAINYFVQILPRIKQKYSRQELGLIQFIQYPGDTVFVPCGAWHAVLNLDDTVAVTQNFMSYIHFDEGWRCIQVERPNLIPLLLKQLFQQKKEYYIRAISLINFRSSSDLSQSDKVCCAVQQKRSKSSHSSSVRQNQACFISFANQKVEKARSQSQSKGKMQSSQQRCNSWSKSSIKLSEQ